MKLVGGYYDAGDNVKFVWPMSFTITLLSWAGIEFREQVSHADQLGHLRTAVRWGAKFLSRAHTSPTVLYTQVTFLVLTRPKLGSRAYAEVLFELS